jgi:hypothetical protein
VHEDARRRFILEEACVGGVEGRKTRRLQHTVHAAFDELCQRGTRGLEAKLHLRENALGLDLERHSLDLTGLRIERRQPEEKREPVGDDNRFDRTVAANGIAFEPCGTGLDAQAA